MNCSSDLNVNCYKLMNQKNVRHQKCFFFSSSFQWKFMSLTYRFAIHCEASVSALFWLAGNWSGKHRFWATIKLFGSHWLIFPEQSSDICDYNLKIRVFVYSWEGGGVEGCRKCVLAIVKDYNSVLQTNALSLGQPETGSQCCLQARTWCSAQTSHTGTQWDNNLIIANTH